MTLVCNLVGGGQVHFRHDTNDHAEPLTYSMNGVNWLPYDPSNPPLNDHACRIALFHEAVNFYYNLPANQRNCNTSAPFAVHLQHYLLGNLVPGGPQCTQCNNPGGVCKSYKYYSAHLTGMLLYLRAGSGVVGYPWNFPNQAPVLRRLVYDLHQHPGPGSVCSSTE